MPGSTQLLAVELGNLLEPLRSRLDAGGLKGVFEDLGLPMPAQVTDAQQVKTKAGEVVTALRTLADKVGELADAITSGTEADIARLFAELVPHLKNAFTGTDALAQAVTSAYPSQPSGPELQEILSKLPPRLLE